MQKFAIAVCLLLSSLISYAQFSIGIKGGLNVSSMLVKNDDTTFSENYTQKFGTHFGPIVTYKVNKTFSFRTGAIYSTRGFEVNENLKFTPNPDLRAGYSYRLNYIDIPLYTTISLMPDAKSGMFMELGYYYAIALNGEKKQEFGVEQNRPTEILLGDKKTDEINKNDFGVTLGGGIKFKKIEVGIIADLGLKTIAVEREKNFQAKNRAVRVSVTISSF